jgi:enamine deaminase RidA (YjgF/YER057c/UK114 family)
MKILLPEGWKRPSGYSNAIKVEGEMVFVAGQVGWNEEGQMVDGGLSDQIRQALRNIVTILDEGGARPEHLVRMTWYVTDIEEYRMTTKAVSKIYREVIGGHYPAMSLFQVTALLEEGAKVEIEATAVIPRG